VLQTVLGFDAGQEFGGDIIVAELAGELVPDSCLHFRWTQSTLETPLGDFIIRSALSNAFAHGGKLHAQKSAQMSIETGAQTLKPKLSRYADCG
jgi:hypothetical protein